MGNGEWVMGNGEWGGGGGMLYMCPILVFSQSPACRFLFITISLLKYEHMLIIEYGQEWSVIRGHSDTYRNNNVLNSGTMSRDMIITFEGGKKVNAEFKGFTIETDQSEYAGGEASAPEPFMLFLASIGTCAGIYVFSFCQSREIPTEGIRIVQSHFPKETGRGIGKIVLTIEVPPGFPEKYRDAVVNAANLCAVKKHIQDPPVFEVVTATVGN